MSIAIAQNDASSPLGCIVKRVASRSREAIIFICSVLVRHLCSAESSSGLLIQYNRDRDLLEQAIKMMRDWSMTHEERLRELVLFSLK